MEPAGVTLAAAVWDTPVGEPVDKLVLLAFAWLRDQRQPTCRHTVAAMTSLPVVEVEASMGRLRDDGLIGFEDPKPALKLIEGGADN